MTRRPARGEGSGEKPVINAAEAAELLGLDQDTVYDYAGRGEIPCRRLGRRLLFSREALLEWVKGRAA